MAFGLTGDGTAMQRRANALLSSESPRAKTVQRHASRIITVAAEHGAHDIALVGSVARGEDAEYSDIDLLVGSFDDPWGQGAGRRATTLVRVLRQLLEPMLVDVRGGLPGWPIDPQFEKSMRQDAIPLELLTSASRGLSPSAG